MLVASIQGLTPISMSKKRVPGLMRVNELHFLTHPSPAQAPTFAKPSANTSALALLQSPQRGKPLL